MWWHRFDFFFWQNSILVNHGIRVWLPHLQKKQVIVHCGPEQPKIQTEVLGHSLVLSLVCLHRSLVCSLAHFAHSLARGTVNDWMAIKSVFFPIFDHSVGGKGGGVALIHYLRFLCRFHVDRRSKYSILLERLCEILHRKPNQSATLDSLRK